MTRTVFSLAGRVALVTGSTGGIGQAIAKGLTTAGARVAINGRDADRVRSVAASLRGAIEAPFDVFSHVAAEDVVDRIIAQTGRFDILVSTVGARDRRSIAQINATDFQDLLVKNTVSSYQLARVAASKMPNPEVGRLIFISSIASQRPFRGDPAYASSKAALESLVRSFCFEFGHLGITANAIAPGFIMTEMNAGLAADPDIQEFVRTRIPARRWARAEEVANAAVFLASDGASYVNGHVLTVDAGLSVNL
jgi:gluconate 5-dehydrogenase